MKKNKIKISTIIILSLCVLACLLLLIPQVQEIIIKMIEQFIVHRVIDHVIWYKYLSTLSIIGVFIFCIRLYILFANINLKKYFLFIENEIQKIDRKKFIISILCMFGLYTLGIASIIRADFLYVDDLGRAILGYRGWENWSRYVNSFLSIFIHADTHLTDISPLPQLIAAFLMAIASVLLVYIICDGKITKTACFLSLPIGLSPYFLECFSYRFDSPYMALSVLICIIPFLFIRNYLVFSICSIISLLIMFTTYQASSGIYIIIVIILCFKAWNERKTTVKEIFRFVGVSVLSCGAAMIFFRFFLMRSINTNNYVSLDTYPINELFSGIFHNFMLLIRIVDADFGLIWKVLLILSFLMFVITSVLFTKRNKIIVFFVSSLVIISMSALSLGTYLVLIDSFFAPRAMLGFGIFIACISIYLSNVPNKYFSIPAVLLCWSFFVFSLSYGNALSDQKRYNNFRTEILLHDLSILFPDRSEGPLSIIVWNHVGFAPSIYNIADRNPIILRLVPRELGGGSFWGELFLRRYYDFNLQFDDGITFKEVGLNKIFDSYYHTIKSDGKNILVILK